MWQEEQAEILFIYVWEKCPRSSTTMMTWKRYKGMINIRWEKHKIPRLFFSFRLMKWKKRATEKSSLICLSIFLHVFLDPTKRLNIAERTFFILSQLWLINFMAFIQLSHLFVGFIKNLLWNRAVVELEAAYMHSRGFNLSLHEMLFSPLINAFFWW